MAESYSAVYMYHLFFIQSPIKWPFGFHVVVSHAVYLERRHRSLWGTLHTKNVNVPATIFPSILTSGSLWVP